MIGFFHKEAKFSLVILHAPEEATPAVISRIRESEPQFLFLTNQESLSVSLVISHRYETTLSNQQGVKKECAAFLIQLLKGFRLLHGPQHRTLFASHNGPRKLLARGVTSKIKLCGVVSSPTMRLYEKLAGSFCFHSM